MSLEEWQREHGYDTNSLIADPRFVDADNCDFRLDRRSPALRVGFEPFDYEEAGVYGDPAWIAKASEVEYPPLRWPPDPPPLAIRDGFEDTAVGQHPSDAEVHVENKGDAIVVTDSAAATGAHSLKISDAPDLEHRWNPHLVYRPNHGTGTSRCAFDLHLGRSVQLNCEWRDYQGSPYHVGPSFTIHGSNLQIDGQTRLALPLGQWVGFEVIADLGEDTAGTWTLRVLAPGRPSQVFADLANHSAAFEKLTWLGFISNANDRTTFHLDNLQVTNQP
jgi:hypothetical protein